jgi:hypothetical protein
MHPKKDNGSIASMIVPKHILSLIISLFQITIHQFDSGRNIPWRDMVPCMHDVLKQLISDGLTIWLYRY